MPSRGSTKAFPKLWMAICTRSVGWPFSVVTLIFIAIFPKDCPFSPFRIVQYRKYTTLSRPMWTKGTHWRVEHAHRKPGHVNLKTTLKGTRKIHRSIKSITQAINRSPQFANTTLATTSTCAPHRLQETALSGKLISQVLH